MAAHPARCPAASSTPTRSWRSCGSSTTSARSGPRRSCGSSTALPMTETNKIAQARARPRAVGRRSTDLVAPRPRRCATSRSPPPTRMRCAKQFDGRRSRPCAGSLNHGRRRELLRDPGRRPRADGAAHHPQPAGEAQRARTRRCAARSSSRCARPTPTPTSASPIIRGAGKCFSAGYDLGGDPPDAGASPTDWSTRRGPVPALRSPGTGRASGTSPSR